MHGLRKSLDKGFTIVELAVAIVVGAIIVGSAATIVVSHIHLSQRGRDLVVLNSYVENKIESVRSAGFSTLSNGSTSLSSELPPELSPPRSGTVTISDQSTGIKRVDISITYNDRGQSRTYSYVTYVGELGVGQY